MLSLPLLTLPALLMGIEPVGGPSRVLNPVYQKCCRRYAKPGKALGLLVHGGIGDPHPALDEGTGVLVEQTADSGSIHTHFPKRFVQRIVHNRILLAYGAFCRRLAKIVPLIENNDVRPLATLNKQ